MKYTFLTLGLLTLSLHVHAAQMIDIRIRKAHINTLFNIAQYKNEGMVYDSLRNFFQQYPDFANHTLRNEQGESFVEVVAERFKNNKELRKKILELLLSQDDAKQIAQQNLEEEPTGFRMDDMPTVDPVANQEISASQQRIARLATVFQCKNEDDMKAFESENCRTQ